MSRQPARERPRRDSPWLSLARGLVTLLLVGWLVANVDWASFPDDLSRIDIRWFILPHLLTAATLWCGVGKWHILLRARGIELPLGRLFRWYLIGNFSSSFLPSNFGGDVVRVALAARETGRARWHDITAAVFGERLTGLYGLSIALWVGVALQWTWVQSLDLLVPIVAATLAVAVGAAILAWPGGLPLPWHLAPDSGFLGRLVQPLRGIIGSTARYHRQPRVMSATLLISLLFYALTATQNWMFTLAFEHPAPWSAMLVAMCVMSLVAMLPVTLNGIGLVEGGYVVLMTSLGFPTNEAVLFALIYRVRLLVPAVCGGLLLLRSPSLPAPSELTAKRQLS